jgi:hypothetical protein
MSEIFQTNSKTVLGTHDHETGLMRNVAGRQGIFTPPGHLIPLRYSRGSVIAHLFL